MFCHLRYQFIQLYSLCSEIHNHHYYKLLVEPVNKSLSLMRSVI